MATVTLTTDVEAVLFYASANYRASAGDSATFTDIQIENGNVASAYIKPYTADDAKARADIEELRTDSEKCVKTWKFEIDTDTCSLGYLYYNGGISGTAGYLTTDYIPVKYGNIYYFSRFRKFLGYDSSKNIINGTYVNDETNNYKYTPTEDGYIRFSYQPSIYTTDMKYIMPSDGTQIQEGVELSTGMKNAISNMIDSRIYDGGMLIDISGSNMVIDSKFDDGKIRHVYHLNESVRNGLPQFHRTEIYNSLGTIIGVKSEDDDIAPLRITGYGTVGANHGYVSVWKIAKNGQSSVDIGSIWTDGTLQFLLVNTDDTYAYFLAPTKTFSSGIVGINTTAPNENLTHVSGATHTSPIDISGLDNEMKQLFPSVNNVKTTIIVDNKAITENFDGIAKEVIIDNEYGIIKYTAIWDYLPNHIGEGLSDLIADIVILKIRTVFSAGGEMHSNNNRNSK